MLEGGRMLDISIIKGIITGFILSLPFGPVGIYCMEITITEGRWKGYASALGMVSIDVLYGSLALLFLQRVDAWLVRYEKALTILVGIFLLLIAIRKLRQRVEIKRITHEVKTLVQGYFRFMLFALANISSVAVTIVIFTTLRVFDTNASSALYQIPIGIFIGGAGTWFVTTKLLCKLRRMVKDESLIRISRVASIFILVAGIYFMLKPLV